MKFGVVNESTTVNRFVFHTLQRNIHSAVITRKTNIKLGILNSELEKSPDEQNSTTILTSKLPCSIFDTRCFVILRGGGKLEKSWTENTQKG